MAAVQGDDPRILETESVVAFGPASVLGRRAPGSFVVDGVEYRSLELYIAVDSASALADADAHARLLASPSPAELAMRLAEDDARSWDDRHEAINRGVLAKLERTPAMAAALAATGHKQLYEAGAVGVGLAVDDPRILDPHQWRGENLLGWSLMHHRRDAKELVEVAELRALDTPALVQRAIDRASVFKIVCDVLGERAPDPAASELLIAAQREGRAEAWLVACLLGHLRVPASAEFLVDLLRSGPAFGEAYVGVALARVAGSGARAELLERVCEPYPRRSREAARYGLVELADKTIAPDLIAALRAGRVSIRSAAFILARLDLPADELVGWLASEDIFMCTLGARVVESILEVRMPLDPAVAQAARAALERPLELPVVIFNYLRRRLA